MKRNTKPAVIRVVTAQLAHVGGGSSSGAILRPLPIVAGNGGQTRN